MGIYKYNDDWMSHVVMSSRNGSCDIDMKFSSEWAAKDAIKRVIKTPEKPVIDARGHKFFDVDPSFFWIWDSYRKEWKFVSLTEER